MGRSCASACFTPDEIDRPLIVHWNGKSWLRAPARLAANSSLFSVSVGQTDNVWAVGSRCVANCFAGSQIYRPLIARWDGGVWSRIPSPSPGLSSWLYAVSAGPGGKALAVGDACVSGCNTSAEIDRGLVLKWNGKAWSVERILPVLGKHPILYGLNSNRTGFVVGRFCLSNCFTLSERYRTLILRWNGTGLVRA